MFGSIFLCKEFEKKSPEIKFSLTSKPRTNLLMIIINDDGIIILEEVESITLIFGLTQILTKLSWKNHIDYLNSPIIIN